MAYDSKSITNTETLSKTNFGKCKLSDMLPALKEAARSLSLNINRPREMRIAIKLVNNSVKNN